MFLFLKFLINRTHEIYNFFSFYNINNSNSILKASTPPNNQGNICKIFAQHPSWFNDAKKSEKNGGLRLAY